MLSSEVRCSFLYKLQFIDMKFRLKQANAFAKYSVLNEIHHILHLITSEDRKDLIDTVNKRNALDIGGLIDGNDELLKLDFQDS